MCNTSSKNSKKLKFCHNLLSFMLFQISMIVNDFFLLLNTKEDILKNVGNQTVAIDFHNIFFPYYGNQWLPSTVWLGKKYFSQIQGMKIPFTSTLPDHISSYSSEKMFNLN